MSELYTKTFKRLKAKGLLPEALIKTTETTQRLTPPIDNLLI
ncbi:MAG: hypothetical protein OXI63_19995 [Candidatus Poribacteria bacterium]|nr:hypothetical protein [Candidatus Poribacteria bacterium]